jgi:GH25 family lysozyme M1 (1,4-beta-N-acetylmuramidase)
MRVPDIGALVKRRRVTLIDVSNVNGSVDFREVRHAGIAGAFLKVSEGLDFNDSRFAEFRREARRAGVRVGGYHFARPDHHPYTPRQRRTTSSARSARWVGPTCALCSTSRLTPRPCPARR